jgi:hypothetical protein
VRHTCRRVRRLLRLQLLLGTVTVQSNNYQSGQGCEATALYEAKKIGATHAVIRPANAGWGKGPKCTAEAYYVAP